MRGSGGSWNLRWGAEGRRMRTAPDVQGGVGVEDCMGVRRRGGRGCVHVQGGPSGPTQGFCGHGAALCPEHESGPVRPWRSIPYLNRTSN